MESVDLVTKERASITYRIYPDDLAVFIEMSTPPLFRSAIDMNKVLSSNEVKRYGNMVGYVPHGAYPKVDRPYFFAFLESHPYFNCDILLSPPGYFMNFQPNHIKDLNCIETEIAKQGLACYKNFINI